MGQVVWYPAPAVKVDKVLDLIVLHVEHPDDDMPAMIQARNGAVLHTDRVLLAVPDDRWRFTADVTVRAPAGAVDPLRIESALQHLYGDLHQKLSQRPAEVPEPPEVPWPEPLAEEALHGLAGDVVRAVEPHTESDPAAILGQFLLCFGSVIGRSPHAMVESTRHGTNEFIAFVGPTSKGRKGTAAARVRRLYHLAEQRRDPLRRLSEGEWEAKRIISGLATGEGLIWAVRDAITKTEAIREKGKVTGYQEVVTDEGVEDKRLLVLEEEFAAPLKVLSRDGNTLSPVLRSAWDGVPLRILTKNFPACATDPHISIITHITKDELRLDMAAIEGANGFANRFMFMCAKRSKELPDGGTLKDTDLDDLICRLDDAIDFARTVGRIDRDEEARAIWHAVYHDLSDGRPGLFGLVTARAEAHVLRLSLLYALLDTSDVVRAEHLRAALAVWQYAEDSARYIFGDTTANPVADEIFVALKAEADGLTREEINSRVFHRNRPKAVIQAALDTLLKAGLIRKQTELPEGGRGRPIERYTVAPAEAEARCDDEGNERNEVSPAEEEAGDERPT